MPKKYADWVIEDFTDLLMPEFITTSQECYNNIQKAYETKRRLDFYIYDCCKKLAKLEKKKLVKQEFWHDGVIIYNYHVVPSLDDISAENIVGDEIVDFGDGYYNDQEILEDYTHEQSRTH